jgi:hypothetical protein
VVRAALHTWLAEPCGLFNSQVFCAGCSEVILTDTVLKTLSYSGAELQNVTCTFGLRAMHADLIEASQSAKIQRVYLAMRNTAGGENLAADAAQALTLMKIELLRVPFPFDHDANDVLLCEDSGKLHAHRPTDTQLSWVNCVT